MKKKLLSKKNFYLEITAVLILVITFALIRYTSIVQKTATNQCFSILDDSRTLLGQMITNEMQTEQEHLEAASALLENLLPDYDNNEEMILQIMNAPVQIKLTPTGKSAFRMKEFFTAMEPN